jgi:hypothetical protein
MNGAEKYKKQLKSDHLVSYIEPLTTKVAGF